MAKLAGITQSQLRSWFANLSFDEQKSTLIELSDVHNAAKMLQIKALRSELDALESEAVPVNLNGHGKLNGQAKRKGPKTGSKVAPKYQDRKSKLTWTGRGLQPIWVREYVKKGGALGDLLIKKTRANG